MLRKAAGSVAVATIAVFALCCAAADSPLCSLPLPEGCDCNAACTNPHCAIAVTCADGVVTSLVLSGENISSLDDRFAELTGLASLSLNFDHLSQLPDNLGTLRRLSLVNLRYNDIAKLDPLLALGNLTMLYFDFNQAEEIPRDIGTRVPKLSVLSLQKNKLKSIPDSIGSLRWLGHLSLSDNELRSIPDALFQATTLNELLLSGNQLSSLPDSLGSLKSLFSLDISNNLFKALPAGFLSLSGLGLLSIAGNPLGGNVSIGDCSQLYTLDAHSVGLGTLPSSFAQKCSNMKFMDLSSNDMKFLWTLNMPMLETLNLDYNSFPYVPYLPSSITSLSMRSNKVSNFDELMNLKNLEYLALDGNKIGSSYFYDLGDCFYGLTRLTRLSITNNKIRKLPPSLLALKLTSLTMDNNCLDCAFLNENYPNTSFAINCHPEYQDACEIDIIIFFSVVGALGLILILTVVACGCYCKAHQSSRKLRRFLARPATEALSTPLLAGHEGLVEIMDEDEHGVRIEPRELTFGTKSTQVPLDVDLDDHFTITGIGGLRRRRRRGKGLPFQVEIPDLPAGKCAISASSEAEDVLPGETVTVTVRLRMLCTTSLSLPLYVVVNGGFAKVRVAVESQLSTRLDADEVVCGEVLGAGSFGTVFRGEWRGNTELAVKAYNASTLQDIGLQQDIEREVEMCFKLRHPNVVSFYGRTVQPDRLYIVMELAEHGSLGSLLSKGAVDLRFKVRVALDVARGMNYLHKNHIIHRDLKSDNVLLASLDAGGSVVAKLSDFNTSRFWGSDAMRTKTKGVGTPIFMAPEILDGKHYSWMADVYSFGVMLWHMWTQKEPYAEITSSLQLFKFVLEGNRLEMPEDLPDALKQITSNSWKHIPEERPSFQDLAQSLGDFFSQMQ